MIGIAIIVVLLVAVGAYFALSTPTAPSEAEIDALKAASKPNEPEFQPLSQSDDDSPPPDGAYSKVD